MRRFIVIIAAVLLLAGCEKGRVVIPEKDYIIEDFSNGFDDWQFITDRVMGGKSTGKMTQTGEKDGKYLKMAGKLSLENNGGFIQMRRPITRKTKYFDATGYKGVRLEVKGDGNSYAVHLRSSSTWLPWQFYQAMFETTENWRTVKLPFESFKPYSLKRELKKSKLTTIAVVALKKKFEPNISVRSLAMYVEENQENPAGWKQLDEAEKRVIEDKGTERPFSGKYYMYFEDGVYKCKRCGAKLFRSESKFASECGWPSFDDEIDGAVNKSPDPDGLRTEITCANCGGHLGHIFYGEGFTAKNTRYCVNSISLSFAPQAAEKADAAADRKAYFAGGCFWGVEYHFENAEGVKKVTSGYIGGETADPSYEEVCSGKTGHAEAVEVVYDASKTDFRRLCKLFFEIHDFTQLNRQGPDIGEQYRSQIFYTSQNQRKTAAELIERLEEKGYDVKTDLAEAGEFFPAEDYHQNYYQKTGKTPYCHSYKKIFD